jgi:hypothetical protein
MALTFTAVENNAMTSGVYCNTYTVEFDSSYPTGGEAVTATNFDLGSIVELRPGGPVDGYIPEWDSANSKIKVNVLGSGAEVAGASSLATRVFRVEVVGEAAAGK